MEITNNNPPRKFTVGINNEITISDCGKICLNADEQVTFITEDNKEYDVARKDWGFYATPSINGRLEKFNFKTALVKNLKNQLYVMIVENEKMAEFNEYLKSEKLEVVTWLNDKSSLSK